MRKQRNKRGKLTRRRFVQTIMEAEKKKDGKPNPRYPGTKTLTHQLTPSN